MTIFLIATKRDSEIQKERTRLLENQISYIKETLHDAESKIKEYKDRGQNFTVSQYPDMKSSYDAIIAQENRTAKVKSLEWMLLMVDFFIPLGLSLIASIMLVVNMYRITVTLY
jgi:hypothetical protein